MIRNIVFDMGNVVIRFDPSYFLDREEITEPADRKLIMDELFLSLEWAQMDAGLLTEQTAEPLIMKRIPERLKNKTCRLLYAWANPEDVIPGMEELIRQLKDNGYGIFLLSNASSAQHEYWPGYPVSRLFDGKMISCDVKTVKPCPGIYRLFTERFGLQEEECVFIDDAPANVAAAVACGWKGIVFHGSSEELKDKLKLMNIRI